MYIESTKTVYEMTLNDVVKLTTLWTTGPRSTFRKQRQRSLTVWGYGCGGKQTFSLYDHNRDKDEPDRLARVFVSRSIEVQKLQYTVLLKNEPLTKMY